MAETSGRAGPSGPPGLRPASAPKPILAIYHPTARESSLDAANSLSGPGGLSRICGAGPDGVDYPMARRGRRAKGVTSDRRAARDDGAPAMSLPDESSATTDFTPAVPGRPGLADGRREMMGVTL